MNKTNEEYPLKGKTVLLAEDEERLRIIVGMMLEELGAEVISVEDGQAALDAYKSSTGTIDLVLLDMRMTGMSGSLTFERLIQMDPRARVVLSSGVSPENEVIEKLRLHHGGFIEKPFNLENLAEVLGRVLDGESVIRAF